MLKAWGRSWVVGLTVLATAVAAWEGAMLLGELTWGSPWTARQAVQAESLAFWQSLKADGDRRLGELQKAMDAPQLDLAALANRPEVDFAAAWWPSSGQAELHWRLMDGRACALRLQGPPGERPWHPLGQPKRPRSLTQANGLGHWEDWATGHPWPGWRLQSSAGLAPADWQLLSRVDTLLLLAEERQGHAPRAHDPHFPIQLVARRAAGPVAVASLGRGGLLPERDAKGYQAHLMQQGLNFKLNPVPLNRGGFPLFASAWDDVDLDPTELQVRPPRQLPGPGGGAWPDMGFGLTGAGFSEGWGNTWQRRGVPALLALLFAAGGLLALSRGAAASRAFLPAMELAACVLVALPMALFTLQVGGQLSLHWQVPEAQHRPHASVAWQVPETTRVLSAPSATVQAGLDPWLATLTQPNALAVLRVLLGLAAVAFLLHRSRLAWAKLAEAGAADFAASALAAGVAHELRTPLASVRVDAELLAHDLAPEAQRPTVAKRLLGSVKRLEGRLEDVMAFARLQGQGRSATEPYAPRALAEEALAEVAPLLSEAGVEAQLQGEAPTGPWYGDPAALRRVLVELLANAAKHGAAPILLELRPDGWAVRDHGPGVPKGQLRRIFLPFERGEAKARGAGLGLALAQSTAQAHGGEAWAELAEGGGLRVGLRVHPTGEAPRGAWARAWAALRGGRG